MAWLAASKLPGETRLAEKSRGIFRAKAYLPVLTPWSASSVPETVCQLKTCPSARLSATFRPASSRVPSADVAPVSSTTRAASIWLSFP